MKPLVYILNGPNLNLLGKRQPDIYGRETLADVEAMCKRACDRLGLDVRCHQSNAEHDLIGWIQGAREDAAAIVLNAAAYTHTSIAILDALLAFEGHVVEVHISDIHAREDFRKHSYVSQRADDIVMGLGTKGYEVALERVAAALSAAG